MPKTMYAIFSDQAYDDFMNGKAVDNNGFRSPKGYFYSDQPSFSPLYPRQEQIKDAGLKLAIAAGGYVLFDIALPGIKRFSHEKVYPFFAEKWDHWLDKREAKRAEKTSNYQKSSSENEVHAEDDNGVDETAKIINLSQYRQRA